MSKKTYFLIFLVVFITFFIPQVSAHELPNVIHITKNGFEPNKLTINLGETVIFENTDSEDHWPASNIHPTHEIYPQFDPKKPINPKDLWEFRFDKEGEWKFHDHLNPQLRGSITVKKAADGHKENNKQSLISNEKIVDNFFSRFVLKINEWLGGLKKVFNINLSKEKNFDCDSSDFDCIAQKLEETTSQSGPQKATEMLQKLLNEKKISTTIDEHQFSHRIGRQTAKSFGMDAKSFLLCPMSAFNGGCQHGFFEYALGQAKDAKEAAENICESMIGQYSSKDHFYCYHGVGHGVLMAQAYDLKKSLNLCDSLSKDTGKDGCWQGVFMENVNAGMKGQARDGIFSNSDPLAPCNSVEDKYKYECYINHAGYLMVVYKRSLPPNGGKNYFKQASLACLKAGSHQSTCVHSLGLLTTNPSWQYSILGKSDKKDEVDLSLDLCDQVPKDFRKNCLIGGLDNILNNDEMNLELRALKYCQKVEGWEKSECYSQIGVNIQRQVIDKQRRKELCIKVDKDYVDFCLVSARI